MTTVTATLCGVTHVIRRFWRSDLPESGKVELYTVSPDKDPHAVTSEDRLGYADPATRVGAEAIRLIKAVIKNHAKSGDLLEAAQEARFGAIELS